MATVIPFRLQWLGVLTLLASGFACASEVAVVVEAPLDHCMSRESTQAQPHSLKPGDKLSATDEVQCDQGFSGKAQYLETKATFPLTDTWVPVGNATLAANPMRAASSPRLLGRYSMAPVTISPVHDRERLALFANPGDKEPFAFIPTDQPPVSAVALKNGFYGVDVGGTLAWVNSMDVRVHRSSTSSCSASANVSVAGTLGAATNRCGTSSSTAPVIATPPNPPRIELIQR
jgi:hypothetical protein